MRLIDAEALRWDLEKRYNRIDKGRTLTGQGMMHITEGARLDEIEKAIAAVENAPFIDAEPVRHGQWVYGDDVDIQCSACGADALNETGYSLQVKSNYCPNCGAKMDGGAE